MRPFDFGSFENLPLLRALVSAGAPIDGKDATGKTPFEVARPGSEMQSYLLEFTKTESRGRSVLPPWPVPSANGIDLANDANAALMALHDAGAGVTEKIKPEVNQVCELDSTGIAVLADGDDSYFDVALSKVDVEHGRFGRYVFYKMQIIRDPVQNVYVLRTNWGRIGEYGKFQQTPFASRDECILEFSRIFKSKTGNKWSERASFKRIPGKYKLVQRRTTRVKHPEKLLRSVVESPSLPCSLQSDVAALLRYFLDVNALKAAVSRCNFNQDRLPFGQLSLSTLNLAEAKLAEIKEAVDRQENMPSDCSTLEFRAALEGVAKLSSEFYELLPMGDEIVQPFRPDDHRFKEAVELIRVLRDLTVTKELLLGSWHRQATMNPIDYAYKALQIHIEPLEPDSMERACLQQYIDNTCDDSDDVVVNQIYALDNGQTAVDIPNKRLLFHGSKNENILGILKHGLLVAPPTAPTTGWMYGKGVYFADRFSKSFGYTSPLSYNKETKGEQPRSFVFVAEVALGKSYTAFAAEYMEEPRVGTHSTHAIGEYEPDPSKVLILDQTGAAVPLGPLQPSTIPNPAKFVWKKEGRWGERLLDEASMKIEERRLDPKTEFPATVVVPTNGGKMTVKLYGPESQTAQALPIRDGDEVETEGNGNEDMKVGHTTTESFVSDDNEDEEPFVDVGELDDDISDDVRIHTQKAQESAVTISRKKRGRSFNMCSEFIVYDTRQIRLKYLVEVTSKKWLKNKYADSLRTEKANEHHDSDDAEVSDNVIGFANVGDEEESSSRDDLFGDSCDSSSSEDPNALMDSDDDFMTPN